ncbi:uncharacterized protein [Rutidosis leptorrhynchoides]|uniref:uncharacterized protein n=1 Tax=Rutidosis leptorrhynchoides TaxID=125765 RepID=UPI003A9A2EBF
MALLYTMTTMVLAAQGIYYGHMYPHLKQNRRQYMAEQIKGAERGRNDIDEVGVKRINPVDRLRTESVTNGRAIISSSPIPFPTAPQSYSPGRELYYKSARSLSSSHTPIPGSLFAQKTTNPGLFHSLNSIEEPLLDEHFSPQSAPERNIKRSLCLVPAFMFLGVLIVRNSTDKTKNLIFDKTNRGFVMQVGRKLMQVGGDLLEENDASEEIGSLLGWAMAVIYMGGRLPQIWLNIKRGNVEGLSPFMFIFALVGNSTYVASILVKSFKWSSIRPNLPWLVDAGGCVLLDSFIVLQFLYFRYRSAQDIQNKPGDELK